MFLQPRNHSAASNTPDLAPPLVATTTVEVQPDAPDQTVTSASTPVQVDSISGQQPDNVPARPASHSPSPPLEGQGTWRLKDIGLWPDVRVAGMYRREVRVLAQNHNGPCSLLALANCLLLRGSIHIPQKWTKITYSQLSLLIADFLVTRPPTPNDMNLTLESALSILPTMTKGLDVDPEFSDIRAFKSMNEQQGGELSVFQFAGVDLVHGWLADPSNAAEFEVLKKAGSYEVAQEMIVEGLEAESKKLSVEEQGQSLSEEDQSRISSADILQRFLQSTSSQLTYPGLFALSALEPGSVVALFRNSHLSVLYRRHDPPAAEPSPGAEPTNAPPELDSNQPLLFQLATDSSLLHEPEIVWESIVDVDGSGSGFFNSEFRKGQVAGGDWAGMDPSRVAAHAQREEERAAARAANTEHGMDHESREHDSADRQLAAALQEEEDERTARRFEEQERASRVRLDPDIENRARPQERKQKQSKTSKPEGTAEKKSKKDCTIM